MAWTVAQYESLRRAIAQGTETVQFEDRKVTYRSLEEMRSILRSMESELGLGTTRPTRIYGATDKGLG